MNRAATLSMDSSWASTPALKSIQPGLPSKRGVLVDIFIVSTKLPNGVPRPVVKSTIWQPDYRRTLYWNPNARPDADGRFTATFYNNGKTSRLRISTAGVAGQ